jgi:hypothetical protein
MIASMAKHRLIVALIAAAGGALCSTDGAAAE